jgi:hypothetical protein
MCVCVCMCTFSLVTATSQIIEIFFVHRTCAREEEKYNSHDEMFANDVMAAGAFMVEI